MKQKPNAHPRTIALLLAAVALPAVPALAQNIEPLPTPVQTAPPPTVATPPPTVTAQPAPSTPAPVIQTRVTPPPAVVTAAPALAAETPAARPTPRTATPRTTAPRRPAQVTRAVVEPAPAPVAAAPIAAPAVSEVPAPVVTPLVEPVETPVAEAAPVERAPRRNPIWTWLILGTAIAAAIAYFMRRRRRRAEDDDYVGEDAVIGEEFAEPTFVPAAAAPVIAPIGAYAVAPPTSPVDASADAAALSQGDVSVSEAEAADVDALMAESAPPADRPWLEFTIRPVRAGMNDDDALVEFELTIGNTGSVAAEDVRISTWMFAAGSAQESEMEGLLIDPPANASVSQIRIDPGEGARVDGAITLSKADLREGGSTVLPVVVADARYRLPGGGEGRTSASFEVGVSRVEGEGITPFAIDDPSGMHDDIGVRLHGEPQRA